MEVTPYPPGSWKQLGEGGGHSALSGAPRELIPESVRPRRPAALGPHLGQGQGGHPSHWAVDPGLTVPSFS